MPSLSQPSAGSTSTPTLLAVEWVILNSGCEDLMSYDEWCERRTAANNYCDTWTDKERTEFWYALADHACTEPLLIPTPGIRMTPETTARELRRLEHIVHTMDDGTNEHAPWNWLRFIDPVMGGYTIGETYRYAHERTNAAFGITGRPCVLPANSDLRIADFTAPNTTD